MCRPGPAPQTLLFLVKNGDRGEKAHDQFDTFMLWLLTKWGFWGGAGWVKKLVYFFCATGAHATNTLVASKKTENGDPGPKGT